MSDSESYGAGTVTWNLDDLYGAPDDPKIDSHLAEADRKAEQFAQTYRGRIAGLSASEMAAMLKEYELILDLAGKTGTYCYLIWSTNTEDSERGALLQKITERNTRLNQRLLFLELEWANTPDDKAQSIIRDPLLGSYEHWLALARRYRPHLLSEPEEKIMSEKSISGRRAWVRFFGEVHGAARYSWLGQEVNQQAILNKLYDPDRDIRREAAAAFTRGLAGLKRTTTYIFNCILADKSSDDGLRRYSSWISARNLDNEADDATVDALVAAVTSRYDIVARYYNLKKKLLNLDELCDYDRYAPVPAANRRYRWEQARAGVLDAYRRFHPKMGTIAEQFFDKRWIDAAMVPGKRGGAYSHGAVPSVHPYIFMNYQGTARDMMTLAHELGHGVHQYLSREQGLLQADTPLTTAETASVFGETLVFQDLLEKETDTRVRLSMLVGKIEDSFATVFRQVAMNRFEAAIHGARRKEGELSTDRFSDHWQKTQEAMFQGSVTLTDDYRIWWSYIPHFISTPGYVYAYAFGELLVLALHACYKQAGDEFPELYLNMLRSGGSLWPHDLVKPLGVDLQDPEFWNLGLGMLDDLVKQAEGLAATPE